MATAYQAALAQAAAAGALDEDKLKQLGIAQLNSQLSNANSSVAQATAAAVKANQTANQAGIKGAAGVGATVAGAIPMASTPNLPVNPNTPEQKYLANYSTGTASGATVNPDTPTPPLTQKGGNEHYFAYGQPAAGFQSGMSAADQAAWNTIGQKYAAGDKSWLQDTNSFREDGNWGSYTDANGNINGWLYAANGTGGYAPVFGGKVGETGYATGTVFYGPDGSAYMLGNDGTLTKNGTVEWLKYGQSIGPQAGYHNNGGSFIGTDANGNLKYYDYDTVSNEDLERMGYYRDNSGMINLINNDYYIAKGIQTGQITPEQATLAKAVKSAGNDKAKIAQAVEADKGNGSYTPMPSGYTPVEYTPREIEAPTYTQRTTTAPTVPTASQAPTSNTNYQLQYQAPQSSYDPTVYQKALEQWSYESAPEWNGSDYERRRDEALRNAQNMRYDGSEYQTKRDAALESAQNMRYGGSEYQTQRDRLLADAMNPYGGNQYDSLRDQALANAMQQYEGSRYDPIRDRYLAEAAGMEWTGSPYDQQRDAALAKYGEEWQGSEYQKERDAALKRAQDMQWNYDPNTDPVWQALQKQYRREGDRASQEAMAQAAMRTGGVPSSYAVTAATQAGDYYAAQLSDRLPQVYQDAYQRYLQEFQRQMGISDQYAGFDDREYARWADQQGKNLDLAGMYNQIGQQEYGQFVDKYGRKMDMANVYGNLGQQDYNRYQDRVSQQLSGADRYNQYGQQDYNQYMDRVNQQLSGADRYNNYDQNEYQRYLDQYGQQIDAADRYNNYGATEYDRYRDRLGQYNTDRNFSYGQYRDSVDDARYADETAYNRAWNEENRAYTRAYQEYRDSILDNREDREWAQQLREYADAQGWKATEWQQYLREYSDKMSQQEREWAYQQYRDAVSDERYNQQYADSRNDTMYERALYGQEYADQRGDTEWEHNYKQTAYNDALEDAALNYLNTNRIVTGRYAEILGVPDGTTYEQYYSRYLGGGGSTSPFEDSEIDNPDYKGGPEYMKPPEEPPAGPPTTVTLPELKSRYGNDSAMEAWSYAGRPWYNDLHELAQRDMAAALDMIYSLTQQGEISKDKNAQKALLDMLGINDDSVEYERPKYGGSTGLYATNNVKGGSYKDKNFMEISG